jgi:hypothetical protein
MVQAARYALLGDEVTLDPRAAQLPDADANIQALDDFIEAACTLPDRIRPPRPAVNPVGQPANA